MKQTIRLTESELHNIIKESVINILNEGQGWNLFKKNNQDLWNGEYDDTLKQDFNSLKDKRIRRDLKNSINNNDDYEYYDEEGRGHDYDGKGFKPTNNNLSGKLGRAAGLAGTLASAGLRYGYNKLRGKY
jgi:hypothetical protein